MNNREKAYLNKKSLSNYKLGEISREQSKFEILHFDCFFFCPNHIKFQPKSTKQLSLMTLKGDTKFLRKIDLWFHI